MISIICPTYNEEKYIGQCIESILLQDYPLDKIELLFVDGGSTDKTKEIILGYQQKHSLIRLLDNPKKIVPYALNKGIEEAEGNIIMRIDAHCIYPSNYVSILSSELDRLEADNAGCPIITLPARETSVCRAIASVMSHKFGVGASTFRVGTDKTTKADTVPFGCFRKNIFDRIGFFDTELVRNQDDEFNGRIIKNGGTIYLIPSISLDYYARDTIGKMAKMFYQYGLFKPLVNKKLGSPATIRQFFPLLFVLGLIVGGALSLFSPYVAILYISVIILYFLLALMFSIREAKDKKDWKLMLIMPFTFFAIHVSYGLGYLVGLFKILFKKKFTVESNR